MRKKEYIMDYKDILKLPEGTHLVMMNGEKCMVVRLREGFTFTTVQPGRKLRIQRYSEKATLLYEDTVDNIFAPADDNEEENNG